MVVCAGTAVVACGRPPARSTSEACKARAQIEQAVGSLNQVNFDNLNKSHLQSDLSTLRSGFDRAQAGVNLPQNVGLRQLGGVPYLQSLSNHIVGLMAELGPADPHTADMTRVQTDVATQVREGQQVVASIKGC
jgi:hypothetical protein